MAENGVNGHSSCSSGIQWKCGFMNSANNYLTAEKFGFKVNASGNALKSKQIWTIEQDPENNCVYIKSPLDRFMASDKYGNVTVESEEKGENEKFVVEYSSTGKWHFKHLTHGNFLCGSGEHVKCFDKDRVDSNSWSIQLFCHPHVTLLNAKRKRYAHLNADTNQIECTEVVPWGADCLLALDFWQDGTYTIKSNDNRFLNCDGSLDETNTPGEGNKYMLEIRSGCMAFKDREGRYMTCVGRGQMKGGKKGPVSRDELFVISDSNPQVQMVAPTGKRVSVRQGQDVSANQSLTEELTDTEIFQLEYIKATDSWAFLASFNNRPYYWCLREGAVKANSSELTKEGHFKLEWQEDGKVAIKGCDGNYLSNKATGVIIAANSTLEEKNKYTMTLLNRPQLVLKSEFGFVGMKGGQFICNKPTYDTIEVEATPKGSYYLKGSGGKYISIGDDKGFCFDDGKAEFFFEFTGQSVMAIKTNGLYLKGQQNGLLRADAESVEQCTQWEY